MMSNRVRLPALVALAVVVLAGCTARQPSGRVAMGSGPQLFGPAPLEKGSEDLGHFAALPTREQPSPYGFHLVRIRAWTHIVENNRRPGRSYTRKHVHAEELESFFK